MSDGDSHWIRHRLSGGLFMENAQEGEVMTDLSGVDLALAVARVMGYPTKCSADTCWRLVPEGERVLDIGLEEWSEWRPDLGNEDTWEVHEWVREQQGWGVDYWTDNVDGRVFHNCTIAKGTGEAYVGHEECGETDAIALCRTVVAMRESDT